jgi:hypothetical protein
MTKDVVMKKLDLGNGGSTHFCAWDKKSMQKILLHSLMHLNKFDVSMFTHFICNRRKNRQQKLFD